MQINRNTTYFVVCNLIKQCVSLYVDMALKVKKFWYDMELALECVQLLRDMIANTQVLKGESLCISKVWLLIVSAYA